MDDLEQRRGKTKDGRCDMVKGEAKDANTAYLIPFFDNEICEPRNMVAE
jgi:hypothetical protein